MTTALFAGSFDPPHKGHLDIIKRAAKIFDVIYVVAFNNPNKTHMFALHERKDKLIAMCDDIPNVIVDTYTGLVVDYAAEHHILYLIRGIRDKNDMEYELNIAPYYTPLNIVYLLANPMYKTYSSTLIRQQLNNTKGTN